MNKAMNAFYWSLFILTIAAGLVLVGYTYRQVAKKMQLALPTGECPKDHKGVASTASQAPGATHDASATQSTNNAGEGAQQPLTPITLVGTVVYCGYSIVAVGVLISCLIGLIRMRTAILDDGRRPPFTGGIAVLAIGAALIVSASLFYR